MGVHLGSKRILAGNIIWVMEECALKDKKNFKYLFPRYKEYYLNNI